MSFLLTCPNCGPRGAYEYRFGGEYNPRPRGPVSDAEWADYVYLRQNVCGEQIEWWFHRLGCRKWFMARRDTFSNAVLATYWPPVASSEAAGAVSGAPEADGGAETHWPAVASSPETAGSAGGSPETLSGSA